MSVIAVGKNNFDSVKDSGKTVLLDFYADWCMPCRMMSPTVEKIAEEYPDYIVGKVNVDEEPELAQAFGVSSIPMLAVLKNGKLTDHAVGVQPEERILAMLES